MCGTAARGDTVRSGAERRKGSFVHLEVFDGETAVVAVVARPESAKADILSGTLYDILQYRIARCPTGLQNGFVENNDLNRAAPLRQNGVCFPNSFARAALTIGR
jgi:hypothetical protein